MQRFISRIIILVSLVAPLSATLYFKTLTPKYLLLYLFTNALVFIVLFRGHAVKVSQLSYRISTGEELLNISEQERVKETERRAALEAKLQRYDGLKKVIEEINQQMEPGQVAFKLASSAYTLVSARKGRSSVYLIEQAGHRLSFASGLGLEPFAAGGAREADMLDWWVVKHMSPLLVEDIAKDFRFDLQRVANGNQRFSSAIIAPLVAGKTLIGVVRLDSPDPYAYSQDDLRLLSTVCGLGAVALENSTMFERTQDLAMHDELTALYSKGYFLELLKLESRREIRHSREFSLLMIDIDNFKPYNDAFGHTMGDAVLKNIALTMQESLKVFNPVIARFGGEEFCVLLPGLGKAEAARVADNLRICVERSRITLRRQETGVTVSVGVATYPYDDADYEGLLRKADAAMYQAKEGGRNRVCQC